MTTIESYIEQQDKIISEHREKTLVSLGICEKEYAPDNVSSSKYPKYEYRNGEKLYYREVAAKVTDEQWAEIVEKTQAAQKIKEQEQQEEEKNRRQTTRIIKRWVPIFEFPKPDPILAESSKQVEGESRFSRIMKIIAVLLGIACIISGCVLMITMESGGMIVVGIISAVTVSLPLLALGEILDYLAELSAIARNGYKYNEAREQGRKK